MGNKINRRSFIKQMVRLSMGSACCIAALGPLGNQFCFAQSQEGSGKILVLVNLFGGIDGLNWIVPYSNGIYYDRRPTLAIPANQVLTINGQLGFHPGWAPVHNLVWNQNDVALVQQVGYPNADRSHFESQDIWSMGRRSDASTDGRGWIGRLADLYFSENTHVVGVGVGFQNDFITNTNNVRPTLVNSLDEFTLRRNNWMANENEYRDEIIARVLESENNRTGYHGNVNASKRNIYQSAERFRSIRDNYTSAVTYPDTYLGAHFNEIAKMIQGNLGTQVYYTGLGGWDHHDQQAGQFSGLMNVLATSTAAFIQDLQAMGVWDDVCLVFFSEFGRNCFENGSAGTDHGHGNNMLLTGGNVRGGVYSQTPSASDLNLDYLDYYIDFRSVFKTVIRDHLGLDPEPVFDERILDRDVNLNLFMS